MRLPTQARLQCEPGEDDRLGATVRPVRLGVAVVVVVVVAAVAGIRIAWAVTLHEALASVRVDTGAGIGLRTVKIAPDKTNPRTKPVVHSKLRLEVVRPIEVRGQIQ